MSRAVLPRWQAPGSVGATPATPNVVSAVSFSGPSTTAPVLGTAVGAPVALDASASSDPAGGTLILSWDLSRKPAGSTATLTITGQRAVFTPDLVGDYEVRVRGTAAAGNWAESVHLYTVNDGCWAAGRCRSTPSPSTSCRARGWWCRPAAAVPAG